MILIKDIWTYLPFVLGSLLFIFVGGVLLFAPGKFIAAGRWWGKQIGFPRSPYDAKDSPTFVWRNWRLPGLVLLSFGVFLLLVSLRSLESERTGVSLTSGTQSLLNQHQAHWYTFAFDIIPIALGIFVFVRIEKILAKVKNTALEQIHGDNELNTTRYLFKAIASIAIIAGLAFLLRHIFST